MDYIAPKNKARLVVSTPLKNTSQIGNLPPNRHEHQKYEWNITWNIPKYIYIYYVFFQRGFFIVFLLKTPGWFLFKGRFWVPKNARCQVVSVLSLRLLPLPIPKLQAKGIATSVEAQQTIHHGGNWGSKPWLGLLGKGSLGIFKGIIRKTHTGRIYQESLLGSMVIGSMDYFTDPYKWLVYIGVK